MTHIINVAAAVIERPDGSYLLGQRAPGTFYPGYWEFPGGKIEPGESAHAALVRELAEELGIEVLRADPWLRKEHLYEHGHVKLHFFRVKEWRGELHDHVHSALHWQSPWQPLGVTPMLPANGPVLSALALPDFYAITHAAEIGIVAQLDALRNALERGLRLVQVREPNLPKDERRAFAYDAVSLCHDYGAVVLVNGDEDLALATNADGIHLPAAQLMRLTLRPEFRCVAASCHTTAELGHAAQLGCDFAVFGPVNASASHPGRPGIGWSAFAAQVGVPPLPVYALGGVSRRDLETAQRCGAHGIAAIRAAWS